MIVVKAGGRVLEENLDGLLDSVSRHREGGLVLVHGGGNAVSRYSEKLGVQPRFVVSPSGVRSRYTGPEELEVFVMVMAGKINKEIVAGLQRRGVNAVGLTGADGRVFVAERKARILVIDERGRKRVIPGGYTGKIRWVNKEFLETLLNRGLTPVLAPLAIGTGGELLNVDADQLAYSVATSLGAEILLLLSDVPGVLVNGRPVKKLRPEEAEELALKLGPGMNRKLLMAARAVRSGVDRCIIGDGLVPDPLGQALKGRGTVVAP